ncbi:MAG: cadherin-like domain-containing protein [Burkholderiaceae bacterium]|nr:cadherin-like domain-containing protein [Burkholderiaceae bacterium]
MERAGRQYQCGQQRRAAINTWPKTTANGGTVSLNSNGTLTYTPAADFLGTDTFTYRTVAQDGSWAEATVRISVQVPVPANSPVTLIALALGVVGASEMMLRRRRQQAR